MALEIRFAEDVDDVNFLAATIDHKMLYLRFGRDPFRHERAEFAVQQQNWPTDGNGIVLCVRL